MNIRIDMDDMVKLLHRMGIKSLKEKRKIKEMDKSERNEYLYENYREQIEHYMKGLFEKYGINIDELLKN